jgi:hypothetical protein
MLTPLLTFAYARAGLAYAHMYHILPSAELMLAYAHQSFAYATPLYILIYEGPLLKHEHMGFERGTHGTTHGMTFQNYNITFFYYL